MRTTAGRLTLSAGPAPDRNSVARLDRHTLARALGASGKWLRVSLPDQTMGYVPSDAVVAAQRPVRRQKIDGMAVLREQPLPGSPIVDTLESGVQADVLGHFNAFELLRGNRGQTGWVQPHGPG